jgi:hypothetical protein
MGGTLLSFGDPWRLPQLFLGSPLLRGCLLPSTGSKIWGPSKFGALCSRTGRTPVRPALITRYIEAFYMLCSANFLIHVASVTRAGPSKCRFVQTWRLILWQGDFPFRLASSLPRATDETPQTLAPSPPRSSSPLRRRRREPPGKPARCRWRRP